MEKDSRGDQSREKGMRQNSELMDETAIQPGVNTVADQNSGGKEELTRAAADDFREKDD